jgi:hypothetical protein
MRLATGDFNGDGEVDLAVSAFDSNSGAISQIAALTVDPRRRIMNSL